ncbi:alpha/beta hydrolase fold domain-containing protein [Toxoplasma gondii TgCatPRC2]|uniref:Alpha/beta hydrolase fold domain-containing protein n=2 Tax=Toxoplasma gondii TaxID=5811 RepID=A0A151H3R1_TOXGO|nr:alpha/beta hydrolase fold domain-containing protein [Toxoplasma gondii TgCatPRC2]PIM04375.1 alpha/beta hydrolase fold domain-containing protein [Toxoplasma gondii COUG]
MHAHAMSSYDERTLVSQGKPTFSSRNIKWLNLPFRGRHLQGERKTARGMAPFRHFHQLLPQHFALRTLCPTIYKYAKATSWPSSRAQLVRDRQLVDLSLRSFYASLRPSRLRNQTTVKVQTPVCDAIIYDSSSPRRIRSVGAHFVGKKDASPVQHGAHPEQLPRGGSSPAASSAGVLNNSVPRGGAAIPLQGADTNVAAASDEPRAVPASVSLLSDGGELAAKHVGTEAAVSQQERTAETRLETTGPEPPSPSELPEQQRGGWVEVAVKMAALLQFDAGASAAPSDGRKTVLQKLRDMSPGRERSEKAEATTINDETKKQKWIFFLHGGAFVFNSPESYRLFTNDLSVLTGAKVFCPDYSLAPDRLWPVQLEQCVAAYEYLCYEMNVPGEDIILVGDSAGGNLAVTLMASIVKRGEQSDRTNVAENPKPLPRPAGMVLLSPWLDLTMEGPSYILNATREPVLPLTSIRQSTGVYVYGRFDLGTLSNAEIEERLDVTSEKLCRESPTGPRPNDGDLPSCYSSVSPPEVPDGSRCFSNPWISPVYFDKDMLKNMPPTCIHVGSVEVLLSDSLIFGRQVNDAVRGASLFSEKAWSAADERLYATRAATTAEREMSFLASLPTVGTSKGVTEKREIDDELTRAGTDTNRSSSLGLKDVCMSSASTEIKAVRSHSDKNPSRVPSYFTTYGWLSEADAQKLNADGVVFPFGCEEATAPRVQVKVWKDEFHVFPCCSFLEGPNGEKCLQDIAKWIEDVYANATK